LEIKDLKLMGDNLYISPLAKEGEIKFEKTGDVLR
jgi:hypothetical protein